MRQGLQWVLVQPSLMTKPSKTSLWLTILIIPLVGFFIMILFVATFGEIVENKNALEEYLIIMLLLVVYVGFRSIKKRIWVMQNKQP